MNDLLPTFDKLSNIFRRMLLLSQFIDLHRRFRIYEFLHHGIDQFPESAAGLFHPGCIREAVPGGHHGKPVQVCSDFAKINRQLPHIVRDSFIYLNAFDHFPQKSLSVHTGPIYLFIQAAEFIFRKPHFNLFCSCSHITHILSQGS